ncbi:MAG: sarcosine oxidase subunit gamma [Proteobacteria bacterium]|nr:sarcosine oxidase subunit gamma [Pseudomonadota bacterium]
MARGHDSLPAPGRGGRAGAEPGLIVRECAGLALASVLARRGALERASMAVRTAFGVDLPLAPRAADGRGVTFIWSGPAQWIAEFPAPVDVETVLAAALGDAAAICDQSHSRLVIDVTGPRVREVLAKGVPVDLHPDAFEVGDVAVTSAHHVGLQLRQLSVAPAYRLSVPRSYAGSFWTWLEHSAAEFGYEVLPSAGGQG